MEKRINLILNWGLVIGLVAAISNLWLEGYNFKLEDFRNAMFFGGVCSISFVYLGFILIIQEEKSALKGGQN